MSQVLFGLVWFGFVLFYFFSFLFFSFLFFFFNLFFSDGTTFWKPGRNATNYMLLFQAVSTLFKQHYPNEILGGAAVSYFYMDFLESLFKG